MWESFFKKLEREREGKMRIQLTTRDFVRESEDLRKLEWNGREIRNGMFIICPILEGMST